MEKHEKFRRLAEKRVNRALKDIRLVGNLSNRATYDFTEEEVLKICEALENEVQTLRSRFNKVEENIEPLFQL